METKEQQIVEYDARYVEEVTALNARIRDDLSQLVIVVSPEKFDAFVERLAMPAKDKPRLRKLLSASSVWETPILEFYPRCEFCAHLASSYCLDRHAYLCCHHEVYSHDTHDVLHDYREGVTGATK